MSRTNILIFEPQRSIKYCPYREAAKTSRRISVAIRINDNEQVELPNPYRFLQSFGHLISKQRIHFNAIKTLKYVSKYCSQSTTAMYLDLRADLYVFKKKSFPNVETIHLHWSFLEPKFRNFYTNVRFNKLFPNLRNLLLEESHLKRKRIAVYFPHLIQLQIKNHRPSFLVDIYVKVLRLNPQLRSLSIITEHDVALLRAANQTLPFLEHLRIAFLKNYKKFGEEFLSFPCLKKLNIDYYDHNVKIPILAAGLNEFSFNLAILPWERFNMDILLDFFS